MHARDTSGVPKDAWEDLVHARDTGVPKDAWDTGVPKDAWEGLVHARDITGVPRDG